MKSSIVIPCYFISPSDSHFNALEDLFHVQKYLFNDILDLGDYILGHILHLGDDIFHKKGDLKGHFRRIEGVYNF